MQATLIKVTHETANIKTLWFKPEKAFRYVAGQFIELYLEHNHPDDRGIKRWFTLSSSPTDELLSITTRFSYPSSSFKTVLQSLKIGSEVKLSEPMGDFVLPRDASIPLVFAAAGLGITPMHSMLKYPSDKSELRTVVLLYSVSHHQDLIFQELFRTAPGLTFIPIISQPDESWAGQTGHLDAGTILHHTAELKEPFVYISGPEPWVETLEKELHKQGFDKQRLVLDFFPGYLN